MKCVEKVKVILLISVFTLCFIQSHGQVRSTKQTKLVLVVDENSETVKHLVILVEFQKMGKLNAIKKYPGSKFFIGAMQGSYMLKDAEVFPQSGSTITIFTQKQFYWTEPTFTAEKFNSGDAFKLGQKRARVLTSTQGELVLKTQ